ncbi:MAG: SUMF1/EgtB/PvdO family nonheme iron enzyme, partial [Opitutales bacterium]
IHDMHGNVMEWCYDYYGNYSDDGNITDPIGPIRGSKKVVRGGSFYRTAQECRSASRASYEPSYRGSEIGFRYVIGFPLR